MMAQSTWLRDCAIGIASSSTPSEICKNLSTIMHQLKQHATLATEVLEKLFHPKASDLLQRFLRTDNEEFLLCTLQVIDDSLNALPELCELSVVQFEALDVIGDTVLQMHFGSTNTKQLPLAKNRTLILLSSLTILGKIVARCPNYARTHISEILGIAKANVSFGIEGGTIQPPEKIVPTQNVPYDSSADEFECGAEIEVSTRYGGGKIPKKRKPRALAKSLQNNQKQNNLNPNYHQSRYQILILDQIAYDVRTSDSDFSEVENNTNVNNAQDRQRCAKIRIAAISLIGSIVTRLQERQILYGFWHAFFENTKIPLREPQRRRSDLLHIGLHDPNTRCRAAALQIAGQLIFSSKRYIQQAECIMERLSSAFLPFAHSLGLQVVSMFEELTQVLTSESSLPVLTQALKCLAVLVQTTTPFQRFQPRSFVAPFVKEIERLVLHRDSTIQVSALMVAEFLVAATELTPEISAAIGAVHQPRYDCKDLRPKDESMLEILEIDHIFDEHIEDESDDSSDIVLVSALENDQTMENNTHSPKLRHSNWLLKRVLQNLGAFTNESIKIESNAPITSVRIESLQVLGAMAQHFHLLKSYLDKVMIAIKNSLSQDKHDLRICAARCLDSISYVIGRTLLENASKPHGIVSTKQYPNLEEKCINFWNEALPAIMFQIRSYTPDATPSIKVCLCDALSNIGVVIFERQSHSNQMNLIGFLSGFASDANEDSSVRCAAVRALAVYVLFPSLQGNLVFVENTAELTLRLIVESNFLVRVKASWALGNISDALLCTTSNTTEPNLPPERISEDLYWRMVSAATEACNDNDKVRCNSVRILGNLLGLLGPMDLKSESNKRHDYLILFQNAITKLIDCLRGSGSAKVKWNTCYALGNLLYNDYLFDINLLNNNTDWQSKLFSTLSNAIVHHPNFKVRINAATALARVKRRMQYGGSYESVWKALLDATERSNQLDNFYEYNHRDQLQEQLCLAICHMLCHAQAEDFVMIYKHLEISHAEVLSHTLTRVINRMVPEKSAPIIACTAYLHQKQKDSDANFTAEQRKSLDFIVRIFVT